MENLVLRRASAEDAELLFAWANDIDVRRNAFQQHEISWEEHSSWYKNRLEDTNCHIYIAYMTDASGSESASVRPIGQVRLEIEAGQAQIDYSIRAESRGKGLGTRLIEQVLRLPALPVKCFVAQVKKSNLPSIGVFEKCGFVKAEEQETFVKYKKDYTCAEAERTHLLICTHKSWNLENAHRLQKRYGGIYDIRVISKKEELTDRLLETYKPRYIFFPHWSYLIPRSVYDSYECVVFHMTDLPFGRGGSPLQNLIVRGFTHTKLSALRVEQGLDTGAIYGKEELELSGTAEEILRRASEIIFHKMIPYILEQNPQPVPQSGEIVTFRRRKPEEGVLTPRMEEKTIYDYIRMLDGEGYPGAFIEFGDYTLRFREASLEDGTVTAAVTFERKRDVRNGD